MNAIIQQHLLELLAKETIAIQKYIWYAKVAKKEGYEQIAFIFIETAEQKKSHTKTLFRLIEGEVLNLEATFKLGKLGSTLDNLNSAFQEEADMADQLYSEYEDFAWQHNEKKVATKLKLFRKIKSFYAERFKRLANNIVSGEVFKKKKKVKWICRKCGLIYESERALKNCPGCEHPQAYFEILNENY